MTSLWNTKQQVWNKEFVKLTPKTSLLRETISVSFATTHYYIHPIESKRPLEKGPGLDPNRNENTTMETEIQKAKRTLNKGTRARIKLQKGKMKMQMKKENSKIIKKIKEQKELESIGTIIDKCQIEMITKTRNYQSKQKRKTKPHV